MLKLQELPGYQEVPSLIPSVYALIDPRNDEVRYIGASKDVFRRRNGHISKAGNGSRKLSEWIACLREVGFAPRMALLERVYFGSLSDVENRWILFCDQNGARLLNTKKKTA